MPVKATVREEEVLSTKVIETTVGRILFNEFVPKDVGYVDMLLTKALRDVIGDGMSFQNSKTAQFFDDIKGIGYKMAFKGGLSFNLGDVIIPEEKDKMVTEAYDQVDEVSANYNKGFITNNERYNQVIDIWSNTNAHLTEKVMSQLRSQRWI